MPRMQREAHVAHWLRMLAEGEFRLGKAAHKLFKAQGSGAATAYRENSSITAVAEVIQNGKHNWKKTIIAHSAVTIKTLSDYTRIMILGTQAKQNFQERIVDYIQNQGLLQSTYITDTTIDQARKIIQSGQLNGDTQSEIADALEDGIGGALSDFRARTIARTETHNAATFAMQETADDLQETLGITMTREWVAIDDERTREAHSEADGQEVGMDEPFDVGGESLDRPGDPSGSPENVINCRCTLLYHTQDAHGNETTDESSGEGDVGEGGFLGD